MKLDRIIVTDDNGKEIEYKIEDSVGIFVTTDNQQIISQTQDSKLLLDVVRLALR